MEGLAAAKKSFEAKLSAVMANDQATYQQLFDAIRAINRAQVETGVVISTAQEMIERAINQGKVKSSDIPDFVLEYGLAGLGAIPVIVWAVAVGIVALASATAVSVMLDGYAKAKPHIEYASGLAASSAAALKRWEARAAAADNGGKPNSVPGAAPVASPGSEYIDSTSSTVDKTVSSIAIVAGLGIGAFLLFNVLKSR